MAYFMNQMHNSTGAPEQSDYLIDMSTPRPLPPTKPKLHSDFTPTLAKALSKTFLKNAKALQGSTRSAATNRALFPPVSEPARASMNTPTQTQAARPPSSLLRSALTNSAADDEAMMEYLVSTPTSTTDTPRPTTAPALASTVSLNQVEFHSSTTTRGGGGVKRPPSTPNTPRTTSKLTQRRRVQSDDPAAAAADMAFLSTPIGRFETPAKHVAADMERVAADARLWGLLDFDAAQAQAEDEDEELGQDDSYADGSRDAGKENEEPAHRTRTPESVVQLRQRVQAKVVAGARRKPLHALSRQLERPADVSESKRGGPTTTLHTEEEQESTASTATRALEKLKLEKDYDAWLYRQELAEWQATAAFLELEKRFMV